MWTPIKIPNAYKVIVRRTHPMWWGDCLREAEELAHIINEGTIDINTLQDLDAGVETDYYYKCPECSSTAATIAALHGCCDVSYCCMTKDCDKCPARFKCYTSKEL